LAATAFSGFVVGVSPIDPITIAIVFIVVTCAALAACALPVARAARVDPLGTLRAE
jgi:ABC-type lipoprotein release transport system permease subunit